MANEKRLIDANALIEECCKHCGAGCNLDDECCSTVDDLEKAPTVDAVEVVHGRWEWFGGDDDLGVYCHCSVCACGYDEDLIQLLNYCPNCGAKMDGDGE